MGKVAVVARVGDEVAVEGEFMFALVDAAPEAQEAP